MQTSRVFQPPWFLQKKAYGPWGIDYLRYLRCNTLSLFGLCRQTVFAVAWALTLVHSRAQVTPEILVQPQSQTVAAGENVTMAVTASGSPPLSYQWLTNNVEVSMATNAFLTLTNAQIDWSGWEFRVIVTNSLGSITSSPAILTVKAGQTLRFIGLTNRTYGDQPFPITVAASSPLPVDIGVVSGPVSLVGNVVTILGAGTATLRATQAGDSNYLTPPPVEQSFLIEKANQTINFPVYLENILLSDPPLLLSASASSGLPVVFTLSSGSATLSGNILTPTEIGLVSVQASQAGNSNYNAAPNVNQDFPVFQETPPPQVRFSTGSVVVPRTAGVVELTVVKPQPCDDFAESVAYQTSDGTAIAGRDYTRVPQTPLDFSCEASAKKIEVLISTNCLPGGDRSFTVQLVNPSSGLDIGYPSFVVVTIHTDDDPNISTNSLLNFQFPPSDPIATGGLLVNILEPTFGGSWRLDWETVWHQNGDTLLGLPPGTNTVVFQPLAAFGAPSILTTNVAGGIITPSFYSYPMGETPLSSLTVQLRGSSQILGDVLDVPGATWTLDGAGDPQTNNATLMNVPAGTHLVIFGPATNWTTPEPLLVTVVPDQTAVVTGIYNQWKCPPPGINAPLPLQLTELDRTNCQTPTYPLNGQISSLVGRGSGVAVGQHVVLTAAHVAFDEERLVFTEEIRWQLARMHPDREPPPSRPRGVQVMTGYVAQRSNELTNGVAPSAGQLDVAALWFTEPAARSGFAGFLTSLATPSEWLNGRKKTELVGYPIAGGVECPVPTGVMHHVNADNYDYVELTNQVYAVDGIRGFPGMDGGAVYTQYADGRWFPSGVYLGVTDDGRSRVHAIDTNVFSLIRLAATYADGGTNYVQNGVINYILNPTGGSSLQSLTVKFPQTEASNALWKLAGQPDKLLRRGGNFRRYTAPETYWVTFTNIDCRFVPPTDIPVKMVAGQDAILTVTFTPVTPPTLTASLANGVQVMSIVDLRVQLQYSPTLPATNWINVFDPTNLLGSAPVTLLRFTDARPKNGFYRLLQVLFN